MPATWWLTRPTYRLFMLREWTSLFVGGYALFLLVVVWRAGDRQAFDALFDSLRSPVSVVLHLVALAMVVFHSVTWFNLTPQIIVLWRGKKRVSSTLIASAHYGLWAVVSVVVAWLALRTN